ncbi:MAG: transposase [Candidatus Latescibacteria bacterium]|nr:transposase [Candidatus Latescibacterota bacterium]
MGMETIRTLSCQLVVPPPVAARIDATLEAFAQACNFVADWGNEHKKHRQYDLHKGCYRDVREQFGLSANLAVRAIARVAPRLANPKTRHSQFKPTSIDYDARIFKLDVQNEVVSLRLLEGRCMLALRLGEFQRQGLQGQQPTSATLKKGRKNRYYLDVQVKEEAPEPPSDADIDATLGVDLGLRQIATDSVGHAFQGQDLADYREHRADVRASLQAKADTGSKQTRKACRRALKRLSGRERRHQKRINHEISKQLVTFAKEHGLAIVFECLKGIRDKCKFRKGQRRRLHSWAFYQLQQFVEYKARRAGVRVVCINPRYTSQTCADCLHVGVRRQDDFSCNDCGQRSHADFNAARNIARWGLAVIRGEYSLLSCALPSGGTVGG